MRFLTSAGRLLSEAESLSNISVPSSMLIISFGCNSALVLTLVLYELGFLMCDSLTLQCNFLML